MFKINTQKIKYFISGVIVSGLLTSTIAFADISQIKLTINGKQIQSDVAPQMINGRVFVPVRLVSENLGAKVDWDIKNNTVVINSGDVGVSNDSVSGINTKNATTNTIKNKIASGGLYSSSQPITQDIRDRVQDMEQENTTVKQTQVQVQQSKPEYEVLKDYPVPEGSSGRPIRYNGSIYFPLRLGAEIYGINFPNIKIDDQNNAVIFPNNTSIELNNTNSITYQYRLYLREDIFSINNNNE